MDNLIKKCREKLDSIRKPEHIGKTSNICFDGGIFLFTGALLGIFAKWLDCLGINDGVCGSIFWA